MDELVRVLNIVACAALAALCSWAVFSRSVDDGVVIKLGLVLTALGFGGTSLALAAETPSVLPRTLALIHAGGAIIAAWYLVRRRRGRKRRRRATDWMGLDSREVDSV